MDTDAEMPTRVPAGYLRASSTVDIDFTGKLGDVHPDGPRPVLPVSDRQAPVSAS